MLSKKKAILWSLVNKFSPQLINFIVTIILSRTIEPYDFGNLSIVLIFIGFSNLIIEFGFGESLIQKKIENFSTFFHSVFWLQFGISIFLFIFFYYSAPLISEYFRSIQLTNLIRVSSLNLIIGSLYAMPYTILIKNLEFHKISLVSVLSTFVSSIFAIYFVYNGFEIYSIIYRQLIAHLVTSILFFSISKWKPRFVFNLNEIKDLLTTSIHFISIRFINIGYDNFINLIFASHLGQVRMGFYNRAEAFKKVGSNSIDGALQLVSFSIFSKSKTDSNRIKDFKKLKKYIISISFLSVLVLYFFAKEVIIFTISEKWIDSISILKSFTLYASILPLYNYYITYIKTTDNFKIATKIEFLNKSLLMLSSLTIFFTDSIEITIYLLGTLVLLSVLFLDRYVSDTKFKYSSLLNILGMIAVFVCYYFVEKYIYYLNIFFDLPLRILILIFLISLYFLFVERKIFTEIKSHFKWM